MDKMKFSPKPSGKKNTDSPSKGKSGAAPKRHSPPGKAVHPKGGGRVDVDAAGVVKVSRPGPAKLDKASGKIKKLG